MAPGDLRHGHNLLDEAVCRVTAPVPETARRHSVTAPYLARLRLGFACALPIPVYVENPWKTPQTKSQTNRIFSGLIRNPETPRERFLDLNEIERLSKVLTEHPNQRFADIIRLLMLTGARRGEVLNARWEQFDIDAAVWTKPATTTKQRRLHRTPISGTTVALLRTIRARVPADCPWVFPGDAEGKPVQEIKRFWDGCAGQSQPPRRAHP
jgi:integrase